MSKNIVLIGIMGVGKSTLGKRLANEVNKKFIDLDKYIEDLCGTDIPTIFAHEGEEGFRSRETKALKSILSNSNNDSFVLSLGGGCVIKKENRQAIINSSVLTIQLTADIDVLINRLSLSSGNRPLLQNQDILQKIGDLLIQRQDFYDEVTDIKFDTSNDDFDYSLSQIVGLVENF